MAAIWKRNEAPDGFKGVKYNRQHVDPEILQFNPCLIQYHPKPSAKTLHDSHGSRDHMHTWPIHGIIARWVADVHCAGRTLFVTYQTWFLIQGYNSGCGVPAPRPVGENHWFRNNAPGKGFTEKVVLLPICTPDDPCARRGREFIGKPICDETMGQPSIPGDPNLTDPRAKAGLLDFDSHGQLNKIIGYNYPGPATDVLYDLSIEQVPCESPFVGNTWRVRKTLQTVWLHPGCFLINQFVESFDCCECCYNCWPPCDEDSDTGTVPIGCCSPDTEPPGPNNTETGPRGCVPKQLKATIYFSILDPTNCPPHGCVSSDSTTIDLEYQSAPDEGEGVWTGSGSGLDCNIEIELRCSWIHTAPPTDSECDTGWKLDLTMDGDECCNGNGVIALEMAQGRPSECCCPLLLTFVQSVDKECCDCGPGADPGCCGVTVDITER